MRLAVNLLTLGMAVTSSTAFQSSTAFFGSKTASPSVRPPNNHPYASSSAHLSTAVSMGIDYSETAQRDVYAMDEWASSCGVQRADGFTLTSDDGIDYYAMTTAPIPAGSPVLYVSAEMIFSANRIGEEYGGSLQTAEQQLTQGGAGNLVPLFRLVVKILAEWEAGEQSPFYAWLNAMPRLFNNGAAMTYACFECLPPYAAWLSMKERSNFVNVQKALQFVPLSQETVGNKDLVKFAYNVAVTRNTQLSSSCRRITPMADMFNHAAEPNVDLDWDDGGNCICYAKYDIPAGSPLTVSLGDPTNPSPLFATYGFLAEDAPGTFCKMMEKQDEMKDLNLGFKDVLFYKNGEVSPEVYDLVLYDILKFDEEQRASFYEACVNGDADTKNAYHGQYFSYTLDALKEHVNKFLKEIDDLRATAQSKDPATHPRLPVIMAHNEFVKQTFLAVQANLNSMG